MSGPAPWMGPMWGFWWIFPLIGLLLCFVFIIAMIRTVFGGSRFGCMGGRHGESDEVAQLRKQLDDLRSQVEKLAGTR